MNVSSDSLIRYSADYYDMYGTPLQRMQSYYYLGRTQENDGQYHAALLSFLDAAQYTDRVDNHYLKGLLYSRLAEMYEQFYDYEKAYKYAEQSYESFKLANIPKYQAYQLYKMGEMNRSNTNVAIKFLKNAVTIAKECGYEQLLPSCYAAKMDMYAELQMYDKAGEILPKVDSIFYNQLRILCAIAEIMEYEKEQKEADRLIQECWALALNKVDSSRVYYVASRVYHLRKEYNISRNYYNQSLKLQLEVAVESIGDSTAESEYFTNKALALKQRAERQKVIYVTLLSLLAGAILLVSIYTHRKRQREIVAKNRLIDQYLEIVNNLQSVVASQQNFATDILSDRFVMLNNLCNKYYEYVNMPKQQSVIFKEVVSLIETVRDDKSYFAQMEQSINSCYDNILSNLKRDLPLLTTQEYKLFCYLCAGFSNQAICLFLDCNIDALYNRISRLRKKLNSLDSASKEQYLKKL